METTKKTMSGILIRLNLSMLLCSMLVLCSALNGWSQPHSTGLVFDDENYSAVPLKAKLLLKSYDNLPVSASLKSYCPQVGNQGRYGTCVGWASAWAARTILYAKTNNLTSNATISGYTFAPLFVYHLSAVSANEEDCKNGARIPDAMQTMKFKGVPFYKDFPQMCVQEIPSEVENKATLNKIKDYNTIFSLSSADNDKILATKKALSNGFPVVIGAICPESLFSTKDLWTPVEEPLSSYGGHAMCVIGYDDQKYGGAFEIMNSWGADWGNGGFFWVKYNDYARFVKYGFEMYPFENKPAYEVDLSGELKFVLNDGTKLDAVKNNIASKGQTTVATDYQSIGDYKITKSMTSGSMYRILISNNEPAYVYVISSDLKNNVSVLFPFKDGISPFLSYKSNEIALPGEKFSIKLDNNTGIDYTCVLYSKEPLDINDITKQIKSSTDSFENSIYKALGNKLVAKGDVILSDQQIGFKATSKGKSVVALIVEITHL